MDYQLEIKQIVDYPRCRIYRDFIRTLMQDRNIRTNGSSYLFYYTVLCSYANFRSSYRKLDGISYLIGPGEWICKASELSQWFRMRYQHQAVSVLEYLQGQNYITFTRLGRGNLIKFCITDWKKHNMAFDYNYPCQKDVGFFFFPIAAVHELVSMGKCSEMDIILDLWMHTIYNDEQVQGSAVGPVVYFRNCTGNPLISYSDLAIRWSISKATVSRTLNKLQEAEYISLVSFTGKHGSVIYLCNYLSTMFNISDVMIDKEEISMAFQIPVHLSDTPSILEDIDIRDEQITIMEDETSVSSNAFSVSKSDMHSVIKKVAKILAAQGIPCCECPKTQYKLYPLSDWNESIIQYSLQLACGNGDTRYQFEITFHPADSPMQEHVLSENTSASSIQTERSLNHE